MEQIDRDGYKFHVDVKMQPLSTIVDTADAPPGKADMEITGTGTLTVTSENPGKNAPLANVISQIHVSAFWPGLHSGLCGDANASRYTSGLWAPDGSQADGCTINLSGFGPTPVLTDGASATFSLHLDATAGLIGPRFETTTENAATIANFVSSQTQIWFGAGRAIKTDGDCVLAIGQASTAIVIWASAKVTGCAIANIG